jgi:hypothetical protein
MKETNNERNINLKNYLEKKIEKFYSFYMVFVYFSVIFFSVNRIFIDYDFMFIKKARLYKKKELIKREIINKNKYIIDYK